MTRDRHAGHTRVTRARHVGHTRATRQTCYEDHVTRAMRQTYAHVAPGKPDRHR